MAHLEKVLLTTDTDFDHYQIVDRLYEGRSARVLFSGPRRAAQSGIALDDNPDLLFDYNQRLLEIANALYPKTVLVIGGGVFTLPMALLTALPNAHITVVELDAGLQKIAEDYFGLQPNPRLTLQFGDGRQFVAANTQKYDLIIVDVFSELQIPPQFLTQEFVQLLKNNLNKSGAVAMNIIASYKGVNDGLIKSQIAAYGQAFDRLDIYPAAYGLTSWLPQNLVLLAQLAPTQDYKDYVRFAAIELPEVSEQDIRHDTD